MDLLIFYNLHLKIFSILETLLQSIFNQTIRPINIMKLSTEFFKGKTDKNKNKDFDSADIKEVNHYTVSVSKLASAFNLFANKNYQTRINLGYSFFKLLNFWQFFTLVCRQSGLHLEDISCCTKRFNTSHN